MLNIVIPHISVQKVTNGYVVQWQKKNPDLKQSQRSMSVEAVCADGAALLELIDKATADLSEITASF